MNFADGQETNQTAFLFQDNKMKDKSQLVAIRNLASHLVKNINQDLDTEAEETSKITNELLHQTHDEINKLIG